MKKELPQSQILVVIVTYNGMCWAERCVGSVRASSVPADILVIDNGSTDGTAEWMREHGVEVHSCPDNPGFGAANNIGLRIALERGYPFVYLLNQDAWVFPDCLARLVDAFRSAPDFGILSPVQYDGSEKRLDRNFERHCAGVLREGCPHPVKVCFVMAAHWLISSDCIRTVGGFSPVFNQYGEDDNYLHRAAFWGYNVGVVPAAGAVHDRQNRLDSRERHTRLKCIASVVKILDPRRMTLPVFLFEFLHLVLMGFYRLSITPWRKAVEICRRYPDLMKAKAESRQKGAFL